MSLTTIPIDTETRIRLKTYATKGESYDDMLNRWMDEREPLLQVQVNKT